MSCCPPAPDIKQGDSGDVNYYLQESDIIPGESVQCFMNRAGDSTGRMDDKTEDIPNKIDNTDIPLNAQAGVNVQFKLTQNSTRTATSWEMKNADGSAVNFTGVTFTSGGLFSGTFGSAHHGQKIQVAVTARDATGAIDTRSFVFSPAIANGLNDLSLLHPLPGAIVTSKFGPRKPPTTGASSKHGGVDFAYGGGRVADVLCAADGVVVFTGFEAKGAGNYVKVDHKSTTGKPMLQTVYMHLAKIYVEKNQIISAGQKIGLEGNTGVGTGAHLHFECRFPNGEKTDPLPLIKGSVSVAQKTNPDNTAVPESVTQQEGNKVMTASNVDAHQAGCAPYGPAHVKDPEIASDPVPSAPSTDPFEKAWFFTMTHEVGPHWTADSPNDPEVAQGLCETAAQRKKCGYVNTARFPGGETKFGIAQGPNPQIKVLTITYAEAKQTGYNNYWKRGPSALAATKPKTAIALFDINYLHGVGNGNKIRANANITASMTDDQALQELSKAQLDFMNEIIAANPSRNGPYANGWRKRNSDLYNYAKS